MSAGVALVSLSMAMACSSDGNELRDDDPVEITVTSEPLEMRSYFAEVRCGTDSEGHSTYTAVGWASDGKMYTLSIRETADVPEAVFEYHYGEPDLGPYRSTGPDGIHIDRAARTATVDADLTHPSTTPGEPADKLRTKSTIPCP
ncbi:hypothetical protein GCM10022221_22500 [Actinocorallia aurea]